MSVQWTRPPAHIQGEIIKLNDEITRRVHDAAKDAGQVAKDWMKANHPWQNQTGEAERKLRERTVKERDRITMYLIQGAPHGIWLEVKRAGEYGVIPRGLSIAVQQLRRELQGLL